MLLSRPVEIVQNSIVITIKYCTSGNVYLQRTVQLLTCSHYSCSHYSGAVFFFFWQTQHRSLIGFMTMMYGVSWHHKEVKVEYATVWIACTSSILPIYNGSNDSNKLLEVNI